MTRALAGTRKLAGVRKPVTTRRDRTPVPPATPGPVIVPGTYLAMIAATPQLLGTWFHGGDSGSTFLDRSPALNHGTWTGTPGTLASPIPGDSAQATDVPVGVTGTIPHIAAYDRGDGPLSIEFWTDQGQSNRMLLSLSNLTSDGWGIYTSGNLVRLVGGDGQTNICTNPVGTGLLHYVLTRPAGLDGNAYVSGADQTYPGSNTKTFTSSAANLLVTVGGGIFGLAYYSRVLSPAEIVQHASFTYTVAPPPPPPVGPSIQGFGIGVTGGNGQPHVFVTNNADTGVGSLRWALAQANVFVDFSNLPSNMTTIVTSDSYLDMGAGNITIAGETCPSPGLTILGRAIRRTGTGSNYIIRNLRHRSGLVTPAGDVDCITFIRPTISGILVYGCSLSGCNGETFGFWDGVYDVTTTENIIGQGNAASLKAHNYGYLWGASGPPNSIPCQRLSVYRNIFWRIEYRAPAIGWTDGDSGGATSSASSIVADVANNLVWEYGYSDASGVHGAGTSIYYGAAANVRNNYYHSAVGAPPMELYSPAGLSHAYINGNYSREGAGFPATNSPGGVPYSVPPVNQLVIAAHGAWESGLLASAGCRVGGLDAFDTAALAQIAGVGL